MNKSSEKGGREGDANESERGVDSQGEAERGK